MIKISNQYFLILCLAIISLSSTANAQFLSLQLKIEPELSTTVEQELSFGTLVSNSGEKNINLGDLNTGIFVIRSYYTQNLFLSLTYPESLRHINPAINEEIPVSLSIAYNNSLNKSPRGAILLPQNKGNVSVIDRLEISGVPKEIWSELYIYVFGTIDVGNIPTGEYAGEVTLYIEYD
tara:strand:- start:26124 stop:26660 length:537 start_codon:yes stop_codon:yes gene_type:complete